MTSRSVLIQCGDHRENHTRLLALALSLQAQGWEPVMLCFRSRGAFFLRRGIAVHELDLYSGLFKPTRDFDLAEIMRLEKSRNPHLYQGASQLAKRSLALARRAGRLQKLFATSSFAHVFIWNGYTGAVAHLLRQLCGAWDIAHSFVERGIVPNSVFVDPLGVNGHSSLHRSSLAQLQSRLPARSPVSDRTREVSDLRERYKITAKRLVFVPLQVQRDTNILYHSDHVKQMADFVTKIAEGLRGQDAVAIVRRHPEESCDDSQLRLPSESNLRYVDEGEIDQWCQAADLVVTINSTVGLTALLAGCPVIALGRAVYTDKSLCSETNLANLPALLKDSAIYLPPDPEHVEVFRQALMTLHTASPKHCPQLLASPGGRPVELDGLAQIVKSRYDLLCKTSWPEFLQVSNQLRPEDTLDLSYRQDNAPVDTPYLVQKIATTLQVSAANIHLSKHPADSSIVIAAQSQHPKLTPSTQLVLDQYLDPHVDWLLK